MALGASKLQIDTYGELKTLIRSITMKQKGLKIKGIIIDTIADELIGKLPGGPTAKKTLDFVKAAFSKPDTTKTNTWLDKLDIDDQFSAIVDDTIENKFLQDISKRIEGQSDNTPLRQDFNMNTELEEFLKNNYKGRTVKGPQNEIKKMKRSQLREIILEAMRGVSSTDIFRNILQEVAKKETEKGDPIKGNEILNKGDIDNGNKVLDRGNPNISLKEGEGKKTMSKSQVISYVGKLDPSVKVSLPRINAGGFDKQVSQSHTPEAAVKALKATKNTGTFELWQDTDKVKKFSLKMSPEEAKSHEKSVRNKD